MGIRQQTRARRRAVGTTSVVAAFALLAGCTSPDDAEPAPTPGPDAATTSAPAPDPASDVCAMIDADLLAEVTEPGHEPRPALSSRNQYIATCNTLGAFGFEFGVQILPGFGEMPEESASVTAVPDLSDESVLETSGGDAMTLWTRRGDHLFRVGNSSVGLSEVDQDTMVAVMRSLLENADEETIAAIPPVDLGPACPPPDSPEVDAALGPVIAARGGYSDAYGVAPCHYLGADGTIAYLGVLTDPAAIEDVLATEPGADEEIVQMAGAERAVLRTDPFVLTWAADGTRAFMLQSATLSGTPDSDADRTLDADDAIALGLLFASLQPETTP